MSAPRFRNRWRLALPLLLPVFGGLAYLFAFEAPTRLIAVNAGALVLALLWLSRGRLPSGRQARIAVAGLAVGALFLPLLLGPEVGGVSRWLRAGPVLFHSGALLLPLVVMLAAQAERLGLALLALAAAALALQPDSAALAALAAACAVLASQRRSAGFALVTAAAAALAVLTFGRGTLEPQVFTEDVLTQVWDSAPLAALGLGALLFLAAPWLMLSASGLPAAQARALAALLITFGAMACLAPFPFPLIGYGASPILGFALGLSAAGIGRKL